MKKLFISCPMKGRTKENILKSMEGMHKYAELMFGEELEVIHTYVEEEPPYKNGKEAVWYLGKSLELLSQADYFVGIRWEEEWNGCRIERETAELYGIPMQLIDINNAILGDCIEVRAKIWEERSANTLSTIHCNY